MSVLVYRFPNGINDSVSKFNINDDDDDDSRWVAIDLTLVVSLFHLKVAIHHAITNEGKGKMRTKKVQSEVMYYLSGSSKYNDAIQDYSISSTSTFIAFVLLNKNDNDNDNSNDIDNMRSLINGIGGISVDSNSISSSNDNLDTILKVTYSITTNVITNNNLYIEI